MARPIVVKAHGGAPMPLLNMLAEVASATLKNDPSLTVNARSKNKQQCSSLSKLSPLKKSGNSDRLTLDQIRVLSDKMLVEMFSEFTSDEMKRNYSYKCYLIPEKCSEAFTSFGNETKSRMQMKSHLLTHISQLLAEANAPGKSQRVKFTAEPLHARQKRLQGDGIKKRKQIKRCVGRKRKKSIGQEQEHPKKKCSDIKQKGIKHVSKLNIIKISKDMDTDSVASKYLRNKAVSLSDKSSSKNIIDSDSVYKKENIDTETVKKTKTSFCSKCHKEKKFSESDVLKDKLANSLNGLQSSHHDSDIDDSSSESQPSVSTENTVTLSDKIEKHVFFDSFSNCVMQEVSTGNEESSDNQKKFIKLEETSKPLKKNIPALKKQIELERLVQPFHDHCYTSTYGKTYVGEDPESVENLDKAPENGSPCVSQELIIPTEAFPYVYVPLLPHISEIKEYGKVSKDSAGNDKELHQDNSVKKTTVQKVKSKEKQTRVRRVHKVIIPEEMEPDSEDDENILSDLSSFCAENADGKDENNSSDIPDEKSPISKFLKNASELTPSQEKKIALKLIRQLRMKKRENRGPLICQICRTKSFTAQATLMYHYRSHAGIKPFSCTVCEATFTRQHSLNYHMLIHNDKSRFVCSECGRKFRHPSHYKEHLRRHTGETPYECSDCPLRFKTRNTYKRHLKTRHGKILTAQGIRTLSVEEFCKVRTSPRKKSRHSPVLKQDQETQWPEVAFTQNASSVPMVDKSC